MMLKDIMLLFKSDQDLIPVDKAMTLIISSDDFFFHVNHTMTTVCIRPLK